MNNSLKILNTFNLKVNVYKIFLIKDLKKLCQLWEKYKKKYYPCLILGEGSNVLFLNDFYGLVIINRIKGIYIRESKKYWNLHVNSGENWHKLVKFTIKKKIYGLENLALIPGCVGSAPIQNIGAYGSSIKDFCQYVDIIDPVSKKIKRLNNKDCQFKYRNSVFKHKNYKKYIIISIGLFLPKKWIPNLKYHCLKHLKNHNITPQKIFNYICNIRKKKIPHPKIYGNAGSFFKNPYISLQKGFKLLQIFPNMPYVLKNNYMKLSAGWLINQCNFSKFLYKGVTVYSKQSLIIVNKFNNSSGMDILNFAIKIYNTVGNKFDIWLEPEVRIIDNYGEINPLIYFKNNNN
ncbi:UDP-N-acetylmuramate dehydrogenase [Enterobacteriaceae endosymbiont of Donacia cincticornis]|uniref:UDP-N-acetylmuramate dehydrogenase n=1 Tax=Enterobacteriaceae endosymbiont of Donacia cincticornis TaxID=2675773 RepID=UPI0014499810|nr:UDP-N-acetylmuramate dehydrogenase [Enterobacteriaceae endosymbiont of Donacia cincticornis]QJC35918.1 UDP-N-acetylmuramate dehydrogenase [Enterobacteriaceae endosymbiont of Donacia cincticornis]